MSSKESELRYLVLPIFRLYNKALTDSNEIDFSDMLTNAIDYINDGSYKSKYKYVIVDEFQDMSKLTYQLLIALRNSNDYRLYAVGDDWQSIYRFAGSDIDYITNFSKHFGVTETFFIPNTYRYSQSIADVAGNFVMNNPNQIRKHIHASNDNDSFSVGLIEGYTSRYSSDYFENKLNDLPKNSEVLFLSRYNYDIKYLSSSFNPYYDNTTKLWRVKYFKRKDLNIVFRSIHSAKGLEADYVFILNNKKGNYGFPSTIQDNSILNYFLSSKDNYNFSEERRLMYVALTRARKKVWLVSSENSRSIFIDELNDRYAKDFKKEKYSCPKCGGQLLPRNGKNGRFLGCSNYPDCKYTKSIHSNS